MQSTLNHIWIAIIIFSAQIVSAQHHHINTNRVEPTVRLTAKTDDIVNTGKCLDYHRLFDKVGDIIGRNDIIEKYSVPLQQRYELNFKLVPIDESHRNLKLNQLEVGFVWSQNALTPKLGQRYVAYVEREIATPFSPRLTEQYGHIPIYILFEPLICDLKSGDLTFNLKIAGQYDSIEQVPGPLTENHLRQMVDKILTHEDDFLTLRQSANNSHDVRMNQGIYGGFLLGREWTKYVPKDTTLQPRFFVTLFSRIFSLETGEPQRLTDQNIKNLVRELTLENIQTVPFDLTLKNLKSE